MISLLEKLKIYREQWNGDPVNATGMYFLKEIYDSYKCNLMEGNPVPEWNDEELALLKMCYEVFFYGYIESKASLKIITSLFFTELLEFFQERIVHNEKPEKLFIFSGSKTNIAIILLSLIGKKEINKLGSQKMPSFSSQLYFELWEKIDQPNLPKNERFYFKIIYNK